MSENSFRRRHPDILLRLDEVLVVSGDGGRLITSGAATAWHDLALYLIARYVGPATAQAVARFMLWEWHRDGQAAFQVFGPRPTTATRPSWPRNAASPRTSPSPLRSRRW